MIDGEMGPCSGPRWVTAFGVSLARLKDSMGALGEWGVPSFAPLTLGRLLGEGWTKLCGLELWAWLWPFGCSVLWVPPLPCLLPGLKDIRYATDPPRISGRDGWGMASLGAPCLLGSCWCVFPP